MTVQNSGFLLVDERSAKKYPYLVHGLYITYPIRIFSKNFSENFSFQILSFVSFNDQTCCIAHAFSKTRIDGNHLNAKCHMNSYQFNKQFIDQWAICIID